MQRIVGLGRRIFKHPPNVILCTNNTVESGNQGHPRDCEKLA